MQARIDRQMISDGEIVLGIDGDVVAAVRRRISILLLLMRLLAPFLREHDGRKRLREESVVHILGAELDQMLRRGNIVEVHLRAPVPDAGEIVDVYVINVPHPVIIPSLALD